MAARPWYSWRSRWETDERRSRSKGYLGVWVITGLMTFAAWARQEPTTVTADSGSTRTQMVTIPDGTLVQLRFAQPVRGKVRVAKNVAPEAKQGDPVRLVAGADVRVGELVVIAKGAIGQATVAKVWHPLVALTGLALRLDWIEDVTGKHVPLKIREKGKPGSFTVQVLSTYGGMVARPETRRGDLLGKDATDMSIVWRKKAWIPAGTRILGFVLGPATLDSVAVKDAQALLAPANESASLTIYRTKGGGSAPRILCDGKAVTQIGARQFATLEIAPGKHSCQAEQQKALEITAYAGDEYFLHLTSTAAGWELRLVTTSEGEDAVADAELAGTK